MNCWKTAQTIAELMETNKQSEIIDTSEPSSLERKIMEILSPFSLEQRQFLISIKYGYSSLLFIAVKHRFIFVVDYFLGSCKADPNSRGWFYGKEFTCLVAATIINAKDIVNILLTHGANVEMASFNERTALYHACKAGYLKIVQLLVKHGANVNRRDWDGQTCLLASMRKAKLFQYLLYAGADVNMTNNYGDTCLTLAFKSRKNKLISLLIKRKNTDARLKNFFEEDALHLAVKFSGEIIVNSVVSKGSYTTEEIIKAYQLQCCLSYIDNNRETAKELWVLSLILGNKPEDTPIFQNEHPPGKLQEIKDYFNTEDVSALLYIESKCGLSSMFTLTAYIKAARNILNDAEKYITVCDFFFKTVHSLDDRSFFLALFQAEKLLWNFFYTDEQLKVHALKLIEMLREYIEKIHARLKRITPQERQTYVFNVESFLHIVIDMFSQLNKMFSKSLYLFYDAIRNIIEIDLRGLSQKSLLQLCASLHQRIITPIFLECRADVNSTDNLGRNVLHILIELETPPTEIIKKVINSGFDYRLVKYNDYCLPCTLQTEEMLSEPVKHISLQCLAAKTFCKEKMNCFYDIPHHLMTIVSSHLYI